MPVDDCRKNSVSYTFSNGAANYGKTRYMAIIPASMWSLTWQ
jgi:hypothetical protein